MPRPYELSKASRHRDRNALKGAYAFPTPKLLDNGEMRAMDAIGVLVAQHRTIVGLFEQIHRETRRRRLTNLVSRLAEELIAHLAAEEAVFYPAMRRVLDGGSETRDCDDSEHLQLRVELRRVLEASLGDESFAQRVASMRELFQLHVRREERELFPRIARAVSQSRLRALGDEIVASRPPVWIVTQEGRSLVQSNGESSLRSRVSLPLPARG
jgi:hemerythrin superfamily protein